MDEMKIKACPHCGGDADMVCNYNNHSWQYWVNIKCSVCGSQGKAYPSKTDPEKDNWQNDACILALRLWNRRVHEIKVET